jgi:hypothetical protein
MVPVTSPITALPPWNPIRLRRDGQRPLRFAGRLIARHEGWVPQVTLWHDIALYYTADAGYAVEIVAQLSEHASGSASSQARAAVCHAALCDTLDGAVYLLENHDPSLDVCPGISAPQLVFDDPMVPAATLALQAAALQVFCDSVVIRYRIGVGVMLAGIGQQEMAAGRVDPRSAASAT